MPNPPTPIPSPAADAAPMFGFVGNALNEALTHGRPIIEDYGLLAVGFALFAETCFFSGFVFPGVAVLVAAGFFAASGVLAPIPTLLVAILGAVLGDQLSYYLGKRLGMRMVKSKRHEEMALLSQEIQKEGVYVLLIYHYSSVIRAVLPYVLGYNRYDFRKWLIYDTIGVTLWIFIMFSVGWMAHASLKSQGNYVLQITNALALGVMILIPWRLGKRFLRLRSRTPH